MIFIIGGAFSGKSDYVKERFSLDACDCAGASPKTLEGAAAIKNFHLFVKGAVKEKRDMYFEIDVILKANPDIVIISDEVGSGVVPVDKFEREYREAVGRVHCYLAKKAEEVVRVVCGIGQTLK